MICNRNARQQFCRHLERAGRFFVAKPFSMCARLLAKYARYVKKKNGREKKKNDVKKSPVLELTLRLAHVSFERKRAASESCLFLFYFQ